MNEANKSTRSRSRVITRAISHEGTRDLRYKQRVRRLEPDGSIPQFSLLCFFRCLSLRRWHRIFLRSISALSMRMPGTESYSSPKHMGNECPLPFASVRRPAPFSTEIASLMRSVWLDLTRQMDPTHFWVGGTVPARQP